ncbi:MAG: hypothetical protein ACFB0G_21935 [Leptolyngbyaceae cyanobacterium]
MLALVIYHHGGRDHFGERGFITFLSTFQLLAIAWLSDKTAQIRRTTSKPAENQSALLWRIIAWGFIFLAADEFLALHEVTDHFIHDIFNIQETSLTDSIDDFIVLLYGIFGAWILWINRLELKPHKQAIAFFKRAFVLLFLMIGLDFFANGQKLLELFLDPATANTVQFHLYHLEDSLKVFIEALLIVAFYSIFRTVEDQQKKLRHSQRASQQEQAFIHR